MTRLKNLVRSILARPAADSPTLAGPVKEGRDATPDRWTSTPEARALGVVLSDVVAATTRELAALGYGPREIATVLASEAAARADVEPAEDLDLYRQVVERVCRRNAATA